MNRELFSESFHFIRYEFSNRKYTDARGGTGGHYIGYLLCGRAHFVSDTQDFWVETGEFVYIPHGCKYESFWYGVPEICFDSLAFIYYPGEPLHAPLQKVIADENLLRHYEQMDMSRGVDMANVGALYSFLSVFVPKLHTEITDTKALLVMSATQYIQKHLKEMLAVGQVARACGVSTSGLYAAFRSVLKKTPVEVKNDMLIELAVRYLTGTDMSITEISDRLGFHSTSYFRRVFIARYGCTPSQMRKNTKTI